MFKNIFLLRPLLAVLVLFIPLYPKFPLAHVTGTYVAIRLDDIVVASILFVWLIHQIKHRFPILKEPITKLFVAYFIAIVASFVTAILIYQTDPPKILLLHLLRRFEYMSLLFLTISAIKKYEDIKHLYIFSLISTVGVLLYGYGQKFLSFPVISTMNSEFSKGQWLQFDVWSRLSSTFAGHYDLAIYLSVMLIIIGGVAVTQKNIWLKILSLIIWIFSYDMLTLTASRVSIFSFFVGMSLCLIIIRKYLWIIPVTILVASSIFASKDLNQRLLATIPALQQQFFPSKPQPTATPTVPVIAVVTKTITQPVKGGKTTPVPTIIRHGPIDEYIPPDADAGVARSGEIRFNAEWPRAITAYRKNMLLGTGLGSITLATDNDYLRNLGESGLLGFITFSAIFIFFTIKTVPKIFVKKMDNSNKLSLILFASMITFLLNATLIDAFEASKTAYTFWIMMGIYYSVLTKKI
jgi:hypothetical protein